MVFENSTLETMLVSQDILQDVMNKNGLVLGGAWDYERMTFDFKYEIPEGVYYLRVPGYAVEGDVGAKKCHHPADGPLYGQALLSDRVKYAQWDSPNYIYLY